MNPAAVLLLLSAPRVFISYSHTDHQAAAGIAAQLRRAGCAVWMDRARLQPGEPWAPPIERAIDRAQIVVAIIGAPCRVCRAEAARAARQGKRIVVILLSEDAGRRRPLYVEEYPVWHLWELSPEALHQRTIELCAPHFTHE